MEFSRIWALESVTAPQSIARTVSTVMSGSLINDRHRPVRGARAGLEGQRRRWASRMRPTDDGAITRSCTCAPALPLADPRMMLGRSEVCGVQSGRKDGGGESS